MTCFLVAAPATVVAGGCGREDAMVGIPATARILPPETTEPRRGARSGRCDAMIAKLRWRYEQLRRCSTDADCNYVEGFYSVVPREEVGRFIVTVSCGSLTPHLVVANGSLLARDLNALVQDQALQAQACQDPVYEREFGNECASQAGFAAEAAPVCRGGSCQIARGADYYGPPGT